MATVMKGLRTPWGDAGGGVYWEEGRVMVRGRGGGQKLKDKRRKRPRVFFLSFSFIVQHSDSVDAHHTTMPMELNLSDERVLCNLSGRIRRTCTRGNILH